MNLAAVIALAAMLGAKAGSTELVAVVANPTYTRSSFAGLLASSVLQVMG